jgi:hypothetical protein
VIAPSGEKIVPSFTKIGQVLSAGKMHFQGQSKIAQ